jgi:ABC-type transport system substrate-binding protein
MSRNTKGESMKKVFALGMVMILLAALMVACGTTPPPQIVRETVIVTEQVEKQVVVTQQVEKQVVVTREVEKQVVVTATPGPAPAPKTLVFADGTEPTSLYPPVYTGPPGTLNYLLYDSLVGFDEKLQPDPDSGLATSWEVGDDQVTWTFHLRQGVKFQDGTDFDANAVKLTLDTLLDPATGALRRSAFLVIKEVNVVDPYTVQIVTDGVFPDLPFLLMERSASIVSPTALKQLGVDDFGLNPVGTGPFKFVEWVPNDHITFEANPDYWRGKPRVDRVIYRRVSEDAVRTALLTTGEADIVLNIPPEDLDRLKADPSINVVQGDSLTIVACEPNDAMPPFDNKLVRQALNYAIDKRAIIDNIMHGAGSVPDTPAPPGVWGAVHLLPYSYDPEKAKQLLAEAGYPNGFTAHMTYVSGRWAGDDAVNQATQAYWAAIGVNAQIEKMEMAEWDALDSADPNTIPGYMSCALRSSAYLDYHMQRLYSCAAAANVILNYCNPEFDQLIKEGRSSFDLNERFPYYADAQKLIWDDAVMMWQFVRQNLVGVRAGVTGYELLPTGDMRFFNTNK